MPHFENDGVKIHYEIEGEGPDLMMIHGFAASIEFNWRMPRWIDVLKSENRLILIDCRGHGKSDKPTDPSQYGVKMFDDIPKLMDHLSIERANFFGYSMGSMLTLAMLLTKPEKVNSAILGGFILPPPGDDQTADRSKAVVEAFEKGEVENEVGKAFRAFAESTGADLGALAAVMKASGNIQKELMAGGEGLKSISVPVMTVTGSDEFLPGDPTTLAKIVPKACHFQIQGRDHLTVVGDPKFHMVVKAFLNYVNSRTKK